MHLAPQPAVATRTRCARCACIIAAGLHDLLHPAAMSLLVSTEASPISRPYGRGWSIRDPRHAVTSGGMENPPSDDGTEPLLAMSTSVIPAASRVYARCCTVGQLVIKYLRSRLSPLWLVWLVNSKLLISRRQACILSLYVRRLRSSLPPHLGGLSNGELTFSALCQRKALDRGRRQHAPARRHIPSPWRRLVTTRCSSSVPLTVLCV